MILFQNAIYYLNIRPMPTTDDGTQSIHALIFQNFMEWSQNGTAPTCSYAHKTAFGVISFGVINVNVTLKLFTIYYPSINL